MGGEVKIDEAVVLVGGIGSRLQPIVGEIPKCLIKFNGRHLLEYTIGALKERGVSNLTFVVSYKKEMIQEYFGDGSKFDIKIQYTVQENPKGGTADAVSYADGKVSGGKFFVIYGDNAFDPTILDDILDKVDNYDGVLCGIKMQDVSQYGTLKIEGGLVKEIAEKSPKPPSNIVFTGIMVLPNAIFDAIKLTPVSERGEKELTTSISILASENFSIGYISTEKFWIDARNQDDIDKIEKFYSALKI